MSTATTPRLVLTRGYPGSGKTTWAMRQVGLSNGSARRVNRDDIRFALHGVYRGLTGRQEQQITDFQYQVARTLLEDGRTVLVDDTNLAMGTVRAWQRIAAETGAEFVVVDVTTPADECIRRDAARGAAGERMVGSDVIRRFAERYPLPWPKVS